MCFLYCFYITSFFFLDTDFSANLCDLKDLNMNIFMLYIDFRASICWEILTSNCLIALVLDTRSLLWRENGDHKHFLYHFFKEVQSASIVQCLELTFSIQIKRNINRIRKNELRMLRQDNLNLSIFALGHEFLTEHMEVTF